MFNFLFPQVIEKIYSPAMGEIKVIRQFGKINIWVGGFEQSGKLVLDLWNKAIARSDPATARKILILGLGCGVAAKLLAGKFPRAKIVGVEIDPEMIKLGKKYFGLGEIKNLKIVCADAKRYQKTEADLIIWDLYIGGQAQLNNCKIDIKQGATIIFNELNFGKDKIDLLSYLDNSSYFDVKEVIRTEYNQLIFCSRKTA